MKDFTEEEVLNALKSVKNGKAAWGVLPKFLKNLGSRSTNWIATLASNILNSHNIPNFWLESKVIAILKPNKEPTDSKNYRPISLLSSTYKLFERMILARLQPIIEASLPIQQAGFRKNRNCCDQALALVTHIENGFQRQQKLLKVDKLQKYFHKWHLTLNPDKSVTRTFHLNNREAKKELEILITGKNIATEDCPKYLGVKFDRTLTYSEHLESVKNKLKTHNNSIAKLAGTSWGCSTSVTNFSLSTIV